MKKLTRIVATLILFIGILGMSRVDVSADGTLAGKTGIFAYIPVSDSMNQNIHIVQAAGRENLFLPSSVSLSSVYFHYEASDMTLTMVNGTKEAPLPSDTPVNISKFLAKDTGDGSQILNVHVTDAAGNVSSYDLYVMKSANIASMFISSADKSKDRTYVDASKSNKAKGSMVMLGSKGNLIYAGGMSQIKGRGNTSFSADKKPYQIKLDSKVDLIQTGNSANAHKTWILLANAYDPTLIHNTVGYKMSQNMGLVAPDCRPIDLYYDGMYRGNYLLSEKVEKGSGRVDIADGFILEQDNHYYQSEDNYFVTSIGIPFVVKYPEKCSKEDLNYISNYVEEMIQAAAAGGVNPTTQKSVWDYIDKQSLVRYFTLQEIVKNADAYASSTYYYMDKSGAPMVAGPVWDLDDSYGIRDDKASTEGFTSGGGYIELFMNLPDFKSAVKSYYNSTGYSKATNAGIDKAVSEISASQKMNRVLWEGSKQMFTKYGSYQEDISHMKAFASGRAKWLKGVFTTW